jgi:hypothetical protein
MAEGAESPTSKAERSFFYGPGHREDVPSSSSSSRGAAGKFIGRVIQQQDSGVLADSKRVVPQGPNPLHN